MFTSSVAVTSHIDWAQIALYAFWLFFAGLVLYLLRENRREGYPLIRPYGTSLQGFWSEIPKPKVFNLEHEGPVVTGRKERDTSRLLDQTAPWYGAPYEPTGNPMQDGVGPASWAERADVPEMSYEERVPKIVPMRAANGFYIEPRDPDPRGYWLVGTDERVAGTVTDLWVDRSEVLVRYVEAEVRDPSGAMRRVLIPSFLTTVDPKRRQMRVDSVLASQIGAAPALASDTQITLLEEDKVQGYFAGGHMYATPKRQEPLL